MTASDPRPDPAGGRLELPRLLVVSNMYPSPASPVFGSFVERQVEALRSLGVPVQVVANRIARTGRAASLVKYPALLARARAAAWRGEFDVVVGHFLYPTAAIARMVSRDSGKPYVLVSHGTDVASVAGVGRAARSSRDALGDASLVVAVSRALEARLRTELELPSSVPTAVVNMGVDAAAFSRVPDARILLGIDPGQRVALFAGNLVAVKGVDTLIQAFASLRARDACDRLVIVGDGPLRPELELRVSDLGLEDRVDFTGYVSHAQLAVWMSAADVFVLPSRNEGLGLVLLEAMAAGTPCAASAVGGVPEVVDDSVGRLAAPGDPEALAAAIAELLALPAGSLSEACVARARANDSVEMARRFLAATRDATGV